MKRRPASFKNFFNAYLLIAIVAMAAMFGACDKDDDSPTGQDPEQKENPDKNVIVQDFMWKAMNQWYFWQGEVSNLSDAKFPGTDKGSKAYTDFLGSYSDPKDFFYNICHKHKNVVGYDAAVDRFSFHSEDYQKLVQAFSGVSKSNGLEFGLSRFSNSNDVFGYVRYIVPDSDASKKDIERGDIFTGVDGKTLNTNNYKDLLFGDNNTYVLDMATISGNNIVPNGKKISLVKEKGLVENPILIDKVIDVGGTKIGYLLYNGFTREYDEQLNEAFGRFKADGATELILDLRYNPGGSVNSARLLSSMVYGTHTDKVFLRQHWNDKVQKRLTEGQLTDFFADRTRKGSALHSLNLNKVYVLALNSTASASELVMNGLAPYVKVIHIGQTTRGKNEFSITMVDDPGNTYLYDPQRSDKINPKNKWAIQPLVGRNKNANGFSDYTNGLEPDISFRENVANMGTLGNENEPMLAKAIEKITGVTAKQALAGVQMPALPIDDSKMFTVLKDNMFLDKSLDTAIE